MREIHYLWPCDDLFIFGHVERSPYPEDKEVEERFISQGQWPVRAYSLACPEGELGFHPQDQMIPIPKAVFETAREAGWDIKNPVLDKALGEMLPELLQECKRWLDQAAKEIN